MEQGQRRDQGPIDSFRIIELTEHQVRRFDEHEITESEGKTIHESFGPQISIQPPSFLNNKCWELTPQGWVGYIPVSDSLHLSLHPKVPVANLFRMLEYAYRLNLKIFDDLTDTDTFSELYERLALILAKRILDRVRKGLYRAYVSSNEKLSYVRGRADVMEHLRHPYLTSIPCMFEENTADLEDNQILLWTLYKILASGLCTEKTLYYVHQAHRKLLSSVQMKPFSAVDCMGRIYNRLNQDYEQMHALCRFFLDHTGPSRFMGNKRMLPVLVDMDKLFELFVVEWLRHNIPSQYSVVGQENVQFRLGQIISINIDITIKDHNTGRTELILDTKYKQSTQPAASDLEQVVAYSEAKGCNNAALIYPTVLDRPVSGMWGADICVGSFSFPLDGDIEESGRRLLDQLISWITINN